MADDKAPPVLSEPELLACVRESGFPFELQVARELVSLGFDVQPSYRFFDRSKKRDAEVDIVATDSGVSPTEPGAFARHSLRLVVECRDSSQPLVFFGLPQSKAPVPADKMDPDWPYCWVDSSRDGGIPNKFAAIAFDESRSKLFRKIYHHQFDGATRYSTVTTIEWLNHNKRPKLHVTDRLRSALSNFGAFAEDSRTMWAELTSGSSYIERMTGGTPSVEFTFLMVVHAGEQYQYALDQQRLRPTLQTSLFTRFHSEHGVQFLVIDFVRSDGLAETVKRIRNTYSLMVGHTLPTVVASKAA